MYAIRSYYDHQDTPGTSLNIFFGNVWWKSFKNRAQLFLKVINHALDTNNIITNIVVVCQLNRIGDTVIRRITRRHQNAMYIFTSQSLNSQGTHSYNFV